MFLAKLDKKDRKRMYEYLMHLLYTAEEDRKAKDDYVTNNLYSSGLLMISDSEGENSTIIIGVRYELNDVGRHLLRILDKR